MKNPLLLALASFVVASTGLGLEEATKDQTKPQLTPQDERFITNAAKSGLAEVRLGELAKTNASRSDVKKYSDLLADDRGKANAELKSLAEKKALALPMQVDPKDQTTVDRLTQLSGDAFDRAYLDEMLKDHEKDLAEFGRAAGATKDPELKAFVSKSLPMLRAHLEAIRKLGR